jgi:hypothetical protein
MTKKKKQDTTEEQAPEEQKVRQPRQKKHSILKHN